MERIKQTFVYLNKNFRLFFLTAGWKVFIFATIIGLIVAGVVGDGMFVYIVSTEPGCFTLISACIWIGIFNSIQTVCKERDIIKREHRSGLHISSYIMAKAIYELVICAVQTVILVVICSIFMEIPEQGLITDSFVLDMALTFFLTFLSSDYLGLAVSSFVHDTTTAMTVMPFLLILQLVMSGVLFRLEGAAQNAAYITISKWGMEALGSIAGINELPYNSSGLPGAYMDTYAHEINHVQHALLMLALFAVIYIVFAIVSLEFVDNDKR